MGPFPEKKNNNKNIRAIENVQRRASKQVPSLKELSYEDRLRTLKLPSPAYRRYSGNMIEVFKVTHSIYDIAASSGLLEMDQGSITHGHRYKINKKGCHLNIRLNSFTHRVVDQWNNLPDWVVDAKTVACFEGRLDKLWHWGEVMFSPAINTPGKMEIYQRNLGWMRATAFHFGITSEARKRTTWEYHH